MVGIKWKPNPIIVSWITFCAMCGSCQIINSTLPKGGRTCPGEEITFTCVVKGSTDLTSLIIAWSSPEYIGMETYLQFTTQNMQGERMPSLRNNHTVAILMNVGFEGEIPFLESRLYLVASVYSLNPTVTCHSLTNGSMDTIIFHVPDVPSKPSKTEATEIPSFNYRCVLLIDWNPPLHYNKTDIDHYIVDIPSGNIRTVESSTLVSIPIAQQCSPGIHINISVVDRCGREGPSADVIPHLLPMNMIQTDISTDIIQTDIPSNMPDYNSIIAGLSVSFTIVTIALMIFLVLCSVYIFVYPCHARKGYPRKKSYIMTQNQTSVLAHVKKQEDIIDVSTDKPAKDQLQSPMDESGVEDTFVMVSGVLPLPSRLAITFTPEQ